MRLKWLCALARAATVRYREQLMFALHVSFALVVLGLLALNVVAFEFSATGGHMVSSGFANASDVQLTAGIDLDARPIMVY